MGLKFFNIEQDPKMQGLDHKLMFKLDLARQMADIPFVITSGVRTPEQNAEVGGKANSSHLTGLGCDIRCRNDTEQYLIVKGAFMAGFERIFKGEGHIHLDIDPDKPQKVFGYE